MTIKELIIKLSDYPQHMRVFTADGRNILKNVRISFPSLFKKATYNGDETGFEGSFLITKEDQAAQIVIIQNTIKDLIKTNLKGAKLQHLSLSTLISLPLDSDPSTVQANTLEDYRL